MRLLSHASRCSGCRACQLVCALTNFGLNNPKYGAITIVPHFPDPGLFEVKTCIKCGACKDVCPTGAIKLQDNGFYKVDREECVGCGACLEACPQNVIRFVPEVAAAFTCTGCGECVTYCPKEAIIDGDGEVKRI